MKYHKLSKKLNKNEWIDFLNYWIYKEIDKEKIETSLNSYDNTKDNELKKLIYILKKAYL